MSFYPDKWIILDMYKDKILLAGKDKQQILLRRIVGEVEDEKILTDDLLIEYDMDLSEGNKIYFLYQNRKRNLILKIIEGEEIREIKLTEEPIGEVIDLNILVIEKKIHILYMVELINREANYQIVHHYYNGSSWSDDIVEELEARKLINPIRLIKKENNLILGFYKKEKELVFKEFNSREISWGDNVTLSSGKSEKLFLDILAINKEIHIVFCENREGNLQVQYKKYVEGGDKYEEAEKKEISQIGSPAYPNIILFEGKMWISWVELNRVYSRYIEDDTWSPIYQWDRTRYMDFIRFKYLSSKEEERTRLNYSFGSISPEIRLLGFGPIEETSQIEKG